MINHRDLSGQLRDFRKLVGWNEQTLSHSFTSTCR